MKPGTKVTIITPIGLLDYKGRMQYAARRGTYLGLRNGMRTVEHSDKSWSQLEKGGRSKLTTKPVDISPCGLLE